MVNPADFKEALDRLSVEVREEGDLLTVRIDMAELGRLIGAPFGVASALEFFLKEAVQLAVSRPPAARVTSTKLWLEEGVRYDWRGNVPGPRFEPPIARTGRFADRTTELLRNAPVIATLRRAAHAAGLWSHCRDEAEGAAVRLEKEVWSRLGAALEPLAHEVAARYGMRWDQYQTLAARPDLCDFMESAPGIGPRFRELPEAMPWEDKVVTLLGYSQGVRNPETGRMDSRDYGRHPAFQAWVRRVPWDRSLVPLFKRGKHGDKEWTLLQDIASTAENGHFSAEEIARLDSPRQWLLFHTAVLHRRISALRALMADPAAAETALLKTVPETTGRGRRWALRALDRLHEWEESARWAAYKSKEWAGRLGDPSVQFSPSYERHASMESRCRFMRWVNAVTEEAGESSEFGGDFVLHAPREVLEAVAEHPDFPWNDRLVRLLIARGSTRRSPALRSHLIDRATRVSDLLRLLESARAVEVRPLWRRLAQANRRVALEYLERKGFRSDAGWTAEDLAPLFKGGGEVTIRATILSSELRNAEAAPPAHDERLAPEEHPDLDERPVQGELFPRRR